MSADVDIKWGLEIPLRDGVKLSATLYLPAHRHAPSPAVITLTPYVGQSFHDYALYFARNGIPFFAVDVRGRGNSQGEFHPANEARDGYDVVEWIAQQPCCNGKVGMWGGSYGGYTQWSTIKAFPPHLSTIVPVASPYRGVDSPMRNNTLGPYLMRWITLISGRCVQEKLFADQRYWNAKFKEWFVSGAPFRQLDTFLGNPSPLFQEWISHPYRSQYWDAYNPAAQEYARLTQPILTITGIYDGDQPGSLAYYSEYLRSGDAAGGARHYLIIGPWDHAGTRAPKREFCGLKVGEASLIDLQRLHVEWYAWTMGHGAKPEFLKRNVAYYLMVADEWRYADSLAEVTASLQPLFLSSTQNPTDVFQAGALETSINAALASDNHVDHYIYDPRDMSLAELESTMDPESRTDQRMIHAGVGRRLIYHSEPFARDTDIAGFFRLSAWLSIDRPDTDFQVAVYDIDLDGGATLLSTDLMRARYRESQHEARLIASAVPFRYDFERFMFVARRVRQRHRLRLVIGPIHSIFMQRNHNSGRAVADESMEDAQPVTVKLFHDCGHPSALHVPIARAVETQPREEIDCQTSLS